MEPGSHGSQGTGTRLDQKQGPNCSQGPSGTRAMTLLKSAPFPLGSASPCLCFSSNFLLLLPQMTGFLFSVFSFSQLPLNFSHLFHSLASSYLALLLASILHCTPLYTPSTSVPTVTHIVFQFPKSDSCKRAHDWSSLSLFE